MECIYRELHGGGEENRRTLGYKRAKLYSTKPIKQMQQQLKQCII